MFTRVTAFHEEDDPSVPTRWKRKAQVPSLPCFRGDPFQRHCGTGQDGYPTTHHASRWTPGHSLPNEAREPLITEIFPFLFGIVPSNQR